MSQWVEVVFYGFTGLGLGIDNLKNIKKYLIGGAANALDIPCR